MTHEAASVRDAALITLLVGRLGRLVKLKRTLEGAGPRARRRIDLMHAAMRSTLVDLVRLDRTDLAVAILARGRPGRPRRRIGRGHRHPAISKVLDEPASR